MENYEEWKNKYYNNELVDLKKYLLEEDFILIKKLGIEILEKIYTENEFESLYAKLLEFSNNWRKELLNRLEISIEEYNLLLDKFQKINEEFNF